MERKMKATKTRIKKTKKTLSNVIYDKRTELEMTQQRLADLCSVDRKTINRIENGHFSPNLDTLVRMFTVLGIESSAVFEAK